MKILITFPTVTIGGSFTKGINNQTSTAIYLLGEILKQHGYEVKIVDPYYYHQFDMLEDIERLAMDLLHDVELVALSSNSFNWYSTAMVIEAIRSVSKDIPIILGGVHPSELDSYVLKKTGANIVIRGEGEKKLPEVINTIKDQGLRGLEKIRGITFKDKMGNVVRNPDEAPMTEAEYNEVVFPNFEALPDKVYIGIPCETSRGCLYNCAFCGIPHKKSWKSLTAEKAFKKMKETVAWAEKKCVKPIIFIADDCFSANKSRMLSIFEGMREDQDSYSCFFEGRLGDLADQEIMEALPANKIFRFLLGIESGYNEGLRLVRKGYTTDVIENILKKYKYHDIVDSLFCTYIVGLPWETEKECIKTVQFAANLYEEYGIKSNISWWSPIPSDLWRRRRDFNIQVDESLYDQAKWYGLDLQANSFFQKTHPNLGNDGYDKVNNLINLYYSRGIMILDR